MLTSSILAHESGLMAQPHRWNSIDFGTSKERRITVMLENYQLPEAVEIGEADSIILGEKDANVFDQPSLSFVRSIPSAVDADE